MKVLVTGHLGYIGVETVPVLRGAGHEVVGLDTGLYNECDFAAPPDEVPVLDVRDFRDVTPDDLKEFDAVVHLAALSNDPLGDIDPNLTYDINLHGSINLARAAKAAGVSRFLFSSSCSLYGAGSDEVLNEEAAFNPVTPYGESKIRVEQALSELAEESFSPTYLRNATAYGVSRRLRSDIVVNNLVGYAVTTGKVLLKSDGSAWRPLVHIRDIIAAMSAILAAPREAIHDEAFNIGKSGENYRIRNVANMVEDVVSNSQVAYSEGGSADIRDYRVDFSKAESKLPGFCPTWTLQAGIEELHRAYGGVGLTADEFLGPRYNRLQTVLSLLDRGVLDPTLRWIG